MNLDTFLRMTATAIHWIFAGVGVSVIVAGVASPKTRWATVCLLAAICAVSIAVGIGAGLR